MPHNTTRIEIIAETLGYARSDLVEQIWGTTWRRSCYQRQGDQELLAGIRQLADAQTTYG